MNTQPSDRLATTRVAILGLGLMGGSLAMALRGRCAQLVGYDPDPQAVDMALARQAVEHASVCLDEIVPTSELLILAAPVKQILQLLGELDEIQPGPAMLVDIGSTKRQVLAAMQALPSRFDALGGHPICGNEKSSILHAEPGLYQGAAFVLCRLARSSPQLVELAEQLVQAIGAHPLWLSAEEHDREMAFTSHLPYLVAHSLVHATPSQASALIGPGYRSSTRLASSFSPMLMDILETNQDMILNSLADYREALDWLEGCLRNGQWEQVREFLQHSARRHAELLEAQTLPVAPERLSE